MKRKLSLLLLALISLSGWSQEMDSKYADQVSSLDAIMETLYDVISGERGEARNWELFKYLFHPEAKLIFSEPDRSGKYTVTYLTPDGYIERSGKWLVENGFVETEIHREVDSFGTITQVFSTYAAYRSKRDKQPFMRGINSIQLQNDGNRWQIVNIYWTRERENNPLPEAYLNDD